MTQQTREQLVVQWSALRPFGGFNFIMADPPWSFTAWSSKGHTKSQEAHYQTQGLDWIKALPLDAHLRARVLGMGKQRHEAPKMSTLAWITEQVEMRERKSTHHKLIDVVFDNCSVINYFQYAV